MAQSTAHRTQTRADSQPESSPARKPVDKFRDGSVHVSIWENEGAKGVFRAASIELRYKDNNDEWQSGNSYASSDLLHLENAAREARSRIEHWQQSNQRKPAARP